MTGGLKDGFWHANEALYSMIHIIGTDHSKTQFWSDAIRQDRSLDTSAAIVERFKSYLREAATSLKATVIAEENSRQRVDQLGRVVSR